MLFPNERICSDRVQVMKILCSKRSEFEQLAFQIGLEIKGHLDALLKPWRKGPPAVNKGHHHTVFRRVLLKVRVPVIVSSSTPANSPREAKF
jgi:hypothetical protein